MRLFEAIIDANHRAVAGDQNAGVHPGDFEDELPVVALTCIDPRLNALFPSVHGLLVDIGTGKLEWLVNGYQTLQTLGSRWQEVAKSAGQTVDALKSLADFKIGEMKFPETKIGETVTRGVNWLSEKTHQMEAA